MKQLTFLFVLFLITIANAQFDKVVFRKYAYTSLYSVQGLGDQNGDGKADLLVKDCNQKKLGIYYGGRTMDTIPDWEVTVPDLDEIATGYINDDSVKDIIISYFVEHDPYWTRKIRIYLGGAMLDTIPDYDFFAPNREPGYIHVNWQVTGFNGQKKTMFYFLNPAWPYKNTSSDAVGKIYLYNTGPHFDTIPRITMTGDTTTKTKVLQIISSGDINGDGFTDFFCRADQNPGSISSIYWRYVVLGNADYNINLLDTFIVRDNCFKPGDILKDINGDHKDDFMCSKYGNYLPYNTYIFNGGYPLDTIPDRGLQLDFYYWFTQGDYNKDGYNDILVSYPTIGGYIIVKLYVGGKTINAQPVKTWSFFNSSFGAQLVSVGDVDGDGIDDICLACKGSDINPSCDIGKIEIIKGEKLYQDTTGVAAGREVLPGGFMLLEPYPNPFNPAVTIPYRVTGQARTVTLAVYNMLGQEVALLPVTEAAEGEHRIRFNAEEYHLPSGIYFVTIKNETTGQRPFTGAKKITFLK